MWPGCESGLYETPVSSEEGIFLNAELDGLDGLSWPLDAIPAQTRAPTDDTGNVFEIAFVDGHTESRDCATQAGRPAS